MRKGLTEIVFILDESGSMHGLEDSTMGGYNTLLARNKEMEGEALFSTVTFNHEVRVLHDRVDIDKVTPLMPGDYVPSGCTALLDAVGGAIKHIKKVHAALPKSERPEHVLFAITTDGLENASHHYTYEKVKHMITKRQKKGWEFLFLGADIDVAAEAGRLGIKQDNAIPYHSDEAGMEAVFEALTVANAQVRHYGHAAPSWADHVRQDNASR